MLNSGSTKEELAKNLIRINLLIYGKKLSFPKPNSGLHHAAEMFSSCGFTVHASLYLTPKTQQETQNLSALNTHQQ